MILGRFKGKNVDIQIGNAMARLKLTKMAINKFVDQFYDGQLRTKHSSDLTG